MGTSVKTICLCISLFVASALITLALRTSTHNGRWLPTPQGGGYQHDQPEPKLVHSPRIAFATFLASPTGGPTDENEIDDEDGYYLSTRVLAYQLLHSPSARSNTSIPFLVLCTEDVSARKRARLARDGATIIMVEKLSADWIHPGSERWTDVMAKLRLFQLTEFSKIAFIDADMLVTASLDGVFRDEATLTETTLPNAEQIRDDEAAMPRTYMFASHADYFGYEHQYPPPVDSNYLNVGFFVFTPSTTLFDYYMSVMKLPGRFDSNFPEQNLLNYAHRREGNMPWKPLWHGWNVNWPTAKDWRAGARSFHAKYWDGDPSHDPVLKAIWREQRAEMEGFYRGRDSREV